MNVKQKEEIQKEFFLQTKSPAFQKSLDYCAQVASANSNVLLIGESGSGKEVAAKYIHALSSRAEKPLVSVNCNAFTETLLEAELFGYEQGAFTGASKSHTGKFELADQGTFFLDEIGDLNVTTQIKLLRTIETKMVERIGSNKKRHIEFRLISATNRDLSKAIIDGLYREDFFYRISTIVIKIPALRERKEDLKDMIMYFLDEMQRVNRIEITHIEPVVWDFLMNYEYPGNIRELKNLAERMVVLSNDGIITESALPVMYNIGKKPIHDVVDRDSVDDIVSWKEFKERSEKEYLQHVLHVVNGNVAEAARRLGISSRQIFNKIGEYGIR